MNFNVILEIFQKNKVLFIILYAIILVTLILIIWWPKKSNASELAKYDSIDLQQAYSNTAQKYVNNLTAKFRLFGQQSITDLLDSKMSYYYGKTKKQLVSELESAGYFNSNMYMTCSNILEVEDEVIFVTRLHSGDNYRNLNIIESSPNEYRLTLDTSYKYTQPYDEILASDALLTVESIYQDINYIEYNVTVENTSDEVITVSLDRTSDIYLLMADGSTYGLSNVESEVEDIKLIKGSSFSRKLIFNVPVTAQKNITHIVLSSVGINGEASVLKYELVKDR